jgi:hypothetical protein
MVLRASSWVGKGPCGWTSLSALKTQTQVALNLLNLKAEVTLEQTHRGESGSKVSSSEHSLGCCLWAQLLTRSKNSQSFLGDRASCENRAVSTVWVDFTRMRCPLEDMVGTLHLPHRRQNSIWWFTCGIRIFRGVLSLQ